MCEMPRCQRWFDFAAYLILSCAKGEPDRFASVRCVLWCLPRARMAASHELSAQAGARARVRRIRTPHKSLRAPVPEPVPS